MESRSTCSARRRSKVMKIKVGWMNTKKNEMREMNEILSDYLMLDDDVVASQKVSIFMPTACVI